MTVNVENNKIPSVHELYYINPPVVVNESNINLDFDFICDILKSIGVIKNSINLKIHKEVVNEANTNELKIRCDFEFTYIIPKTVKDRNIRFKIGGKLRSSYIYKEQQNEKEIIYELYKLLPFKHFSEEYNVKVSIEHFILIDNEQ